MWGCNQRSNHLYDARPSRSIAANDNLRIRLAVNNSEAYGTALAKTETTAYENATSRVLSVTDALSQVKTYTYATDDRLTDITYTASVNPTTNINIRWDFVYPRPTEMTDATGTTYYTYGGVGANGALKLSNVDAYPYNNDTIAYIYDNLGRMATRTIAGGNESFTYDAIGRLGTHTTPLGMFTYSYLGQTGQVASRSVTNGAVTVSTNWGYDVNSNDRKLISINNSGVTRDYTLTYANNPLQAGAKNPYRIGGMTDTAAATHPWVTQSHAYTYDLSDRLLTASATAPGNSTYVYDKLDNATTFTQAGVTKNPTYNANNQMATWGALTYAYDNNGNTMSGDGVKTYKWDAENRLKEINYVGGANKTVFTYDGLGRRTVVAETVGGVTTSTRYLWCGTSICQTRTSADTVTRRQLAEGEFNVTTSQKLVYMPDQLGSARDVIDATTGTLVKAYDYSPYGAITRNWGATETDYRYARLFYHTNSALNLATWRAQDGVTGRWLNRDLIGEDGGINLYGYVSSNPTNMIDRTGLTGAAIILPILIVITPVVIANYWWQMTHPVVIPSGPVFNEAADPVPPLPEGIIGDNPKDGGGRINTDKPAEDLPELIEDLTGGILEDDPKNPGHKVCPNKVRIRPSTGDGPRIDIPASGNKPHETIHFPPETIWPY